MRLGEAWNKLLSTHSMYKVVGELLNSIQRECWCAGVYDINFLFGESKSIKVV
jgi:hypothetical protein